MVCPKCGTKNLESVDFCILCGQNLRSGYVNSGVDSQQFGGQQYYNQQQYYGQQFGGNPYTSPQNTGGTEYLRNTRLRRPADIGFGESIKAYFLNYVNFDGRASRREYWFAWLFTFIVTFSVSFIIGFICGLYNISLTVIQNNVINACISLVFILPSFAVMTRRLHDIGKSGAYLLMLLIPLAGPIIIIVYMCLSSVEDNQWGQGPLNMSPAFVNGAPTQPFYGQPYSGQPFYNGQPYYGNQPPYDGQFTNGQQPPVSKEQYESEEQN